MITVLLLLLGLILVVAAAVMLRRRLAVQRQDALVLNRRLDALMPAASASAGAPTAARLLDWVAANVPAFLERDLARADLEVRARGLVVFGAIWLVLVALGWGWAGVSGLLIAGTLGLLLPVLWVKRLAAKRLAAFGELLPHFLDAIRQLLLIGNSFQQALVKATEASREPVQRYLNPAIRRINNGAPIVDALETVATKIDVAEFHMVVAAVRTNARFGGSIAPTLQNLIRLLRDRARVLRELSAASAETRLSATVLCALPPVALGIISLINYGYMKYLFETPGGHRLLLIGLGFQVVGVLVMRRLMRLAF